MPQLVLFYNRISIFIVPIGRYINFNDLFIETGFFIFTIMYISIYFIIIYT